MGSGSLLKVLAKNFDVLAGSVSRTALPSLSPPPPPPKLIFGSLFFGSSLYRFVLSFRNGDDFSSNGWILSDVFARPVQCSIAVAVLDSCGP